MKKALLLILLLRFYAIFCQGELDENVFLHVASTNVISGEFIHFSAYTYQEGSGKISDLSRILYVELVDENGESRSQLKIELLNGRGHGRMFITASIETGIYRLSAYTRWMKNDSQWFNQPLVVINPYRYYTSKNDTVLSKYVPYKVEELVEVDTLASFEKSSVINQNIYISEKASLSTVVSRVNNHFFKNEFKPSDIGLSTKMDIPFLYPEYQYGLIQGSSNSPNTWITSSFQSREMEIDAVRTDSDGNFRLIYDPAKLTTGLGSLIIENEGQNDLEIYPEYYNNYPSIRTNLTFTDSDLEEIKERSIYSQLMNAYVDPASQADEKGSRFIPVDLAKTYKLDEYKRFNTMRETFIELIFEVAASKNEENNSLSVRTEFIGKEQKQEEPLILLDGIQVTSSDILDLSPYLIEEISVLSKLYFVGGCLYDGIISVRTFKNDLGGKQLDRSIALDPMEVALETNTNRVNLEETKHPHFEHLLYFEANRKHHGGQLNIEFNASHNTGVYQMTIKGIAESGKKISQVHYFVVE